MLRTNDNQKLLILSMVASLWCQAATTSFATAAGAPLPAGVSSQAAAANVSPDAPAQHQSPDQIVPPMLPGTTGSNYDDAMRFGEQAYVNKTYIMAVDNFQAAL